MELLSQSTDDHFHEAAIRWPFEISKVDKGLIPKNGDPCPAGFENPIGHRDDVQDPAKGFRFLLYNPSLFINGGSSRIFPDTMSFLRVPTFPERRHNVTVTTNLDKRGNHVT